MKEMMFDVSVDRVGFVCGNSRSMEFTDTKKDIEDILTSSSFQLLEPEIYDYFTKTKQCSFNSARAQLLNANSDGKIYPCHLSIDKAKFARNRLRFSNIRNKKSYKKCSNCSISWNCAQCFAAKEKINFEGCKKRKIE